MKQLFVLLLCLPLLLGCQRQNGTGSQVTFQSLDMGQEVNVSCFSLEPNGSMWVGLDGSGLAYKESATSPFRYYNKLAGTLPSDVVLCSYKTHDGRLWFGTFGNGLFYWENGMFRQPEKASWQAKELEYPSAFLEDKVQRLWVATLKEGIVVLDSSQQTGIVNAENSALATNYVTDLKSFDRQTIYVATGWGLFTLDTETRNVAPLLDRQGRAFLERQLIRILYPGNDGILWIGTRTGLYIFDTHKKTYTRLTTKEGLADNFVKSIGRDQHGNIWLTADHAITRISADGSHCQPFYAKNGIGDVTFHVRAIACNTDGDMLFGSSKGCLVAKNTNGGVAEIADGGVSLSWLVAVLIIIIGVFGALFLFRRKHKKAVHYSEIEASKIEVNSANEQLKQKAVRIVEENISDSDFSVEQLSEALGMSRAHLYKKLMAITGKSPIEFIRIIRIKRGRQLLEQSGDSISQIAWNIGMSPKQFAKYFKEEYGQLPSDFIKSK